MNNNKMNFKDYRLNEFENLNNLANDPRGSIKRVTCSLTRRNIKGHLYPCKKQFKNERGLRVHRAQVRHYND